MSGLGNKEIMAANLQYYMEKNNLSRQDLCQAIGVKYTTLTDWLKANTYPRIDKIELMANYFGITKADLVEERKEASADDTAAFRDRMKQEYGVLFDLVEKADEKQRKQIETIIKTIVGEDDDWGA